MSDEYQAYLLRFQRSSAQVHWRVYVENAESGEILRFDTEWELFHFLTHALAISPASNSPLPQSSDSPPGPSFLE